MGFDFLNHYFFNFWSIPYWVSFFISLILTFLLFVKKRDNRQVQLFIIAQFFVTITTLAGALATCSLDPDIWLFWISMTVGTSSLAVPTMFFFSHIFLERSTIFARKKVFVIYLIPLFFISLLLTNIELLYPEVVPSDHSYFGLYDGTDPFIPYLWAFFYVYYGLILILTTINYFRMFRQHDHLEMRRRAAYFILSSLIIVITLTITSFFEFIGYQSKLEPSVVSFSITGAIITYGILKERLFNIDLIITKSVKYTLLNLALAWIFLLSRETLTPLIAERLFSGDQVATLTSGFLVVTVFVPIKVAASNITAKLFPHVSSALKSPKTKNLEVYRKQLECIWDVFGTITDKDRVLLNTLSSSLGMTTEDVERLEREILGTHNPI